MIDELYPHESIQIEPAIQSHYINYEARNRNVTNHWHPHLELLYIQKGCLTVEINKKKLLLFPGDFALINSREIHSTRCTDLTKVILLQIPCALFESSISDFDHIRFYNQPSNTEDKIVFKELMLKLNQIYADKTDGWQFLFQSTLYQLLYKVYSIGYETISTSHKVKSERNLNRLETIIQYVSRHYKESISLEKAAQVTGFNPEYFCRFFKKHMGVTFLTYVNQIRLSHVYEELISTDYTITEILEHHGFNNYHLFMKMFKQTYGCTPLQKRKQLTQGQ